MDHVWLSEHVMWCKWYHFQTTECPDYVLIKNVCISDFSTHFLHSFTQVYNRNCFLCSDEFIDLFICLSVQLIV